MIFYFLSSIIICIQNLRGNGVMAFSQLVNSMAMLLLMILPGFIFKKLKMINEDQTKSV